MAAKEPKTEQDPRFSMEGTTATQWAEARDQLEQAGTYWLSTVRPEGRPHVTTLIAVWVDDALHFCTGPGERKAKNLARNPHVILTTGGNDLDSGLDVVVEGDAVRVTDDAALGRIADAYESKYGPDWRFEVRDGAFHQEGIPDGAIVFQVTPSTAFGFRKGEYSQTRWRFDRV